MIPEIWYATDGRMDRWAEKVTYRGGCLEKKKIIVNKILLSKLWYIGQIYTIPKFIKEKIEKKTNKKSSNLHLEVRIRYFRHRYSMKLSRTSTNLKIIKSHQCSLQRSHAVLIELKE